MTRRRIFLASLLLLASVASIVGWQVHRAAQPMQITLRFHPFVGDHVLQLNEAHYANPGGNGTFTVRDFQFFLSNIRLVADAGEYREPNSYHLVRFDGDAPGYEIVLNDVPRAAYRRIEFAIGVDSAANGSIAAVGDLDPNGRMAWTWEVGYKFVLLEGGLVVGDDQYPLVYHVGFNENYKPVSIELDPSRTVGHEAILDFRTDLLRMFTGTKVVNMAILPNVKFDRGDSKLLADNYARMVSLCREHCPP
jgi:MbnP